MTSQVTSVPGTTLAAVGAGSVTARPSTITGTALTSGGKPELFYAPKAKYIWALAFDSKGDLLVATGDPGQVHRVTPSGSGSIFFQPDETGARKLLRTHTSPVQVRTMLTQKPPIRVICPGRTYRCDSDQTHTPMFHQVEGLVIDKGAHMGQLKWVLETFISRFFETDSVTTQFRPHHFPFTEPSAEMDVRCSWEKGELKVGTGESWLEILGCGMVHPNVLKACGVDPEEYQGFAWGMGVDRLAMLKYGVPDLRDMFAADTRWLAHYGFSGFVAPNPASGLS